MVTSILYILYMDTPRCKTQKDTKSWLLTQKNIKCWLLGVTVAMVAKNKDGKIAKLSYFEAIIEVFAH